MSRSLLLLVLLGCLCSSSFAAYAFGTFQRPYSAQSLWNSRPVNPVFHATARIPTSNVGYYPSISGGTYSTGMFYGQASDPAATVYPQSGKTSVNNVDGFSGLPSVTVPHWPKDAVPATGSDGHCDIFDSTTGILHSFFMLVNASGVWRANMYAWQYVSGTGWGDGAHFYLGARAAGVAPSAGLIRKHEVNDGAQYYTHALAMSLAAAGLAANPKYAYPATSGDGDASGNTGIIPEGGLVMLPASYNSSKMNNYPVLKKVVETLKRFGAYVVDRNYETPYVIYVENGAPFKMSNLSGWDNTLAAFLQDIRANLRYVTSAEKWLDGNGATLNIPTYQNMLSMRGGDPSSWNRVYGNANVRYDTLSQSLSYDSANTQATAHENWSALGYGKVGWAAFQVNKPYRFFVTSTGNCTLAIVAINGTTGVLVQQSGFIANGAGWNFQHKAGTYYMLRAYKPAGGPAKVRGSVVLNYVADIPYRGNNTLTNPNP